MKLFVQFAQMIVTKLVTLYAKRENVKSGVDFR